MARTVRKSGVKEVPHEEYPSPKFVLYYESGDRDCAAPTEGRPSNVAVVSTRLHGQDAEPPEAGNCDAWHAAMVTRRHPDFDFFDGIASS
jgi:hypothetical protein